MLNLKYSPSIVVDDIEKLTYEEWLHNRTTGIGGSDAAALYDVSPWTTKRALYYAKIGLQKAEMPNPFTLFFGHEVEPTVAKWFATTFEENYKEWLEEKIGEKISNFCLYKDSSMYRHPLETFMQANLDYRWTVITVSGKKIEGIFECKTTSYHIGEEKWKDDSVPYYYELQCRHYMSVMNLPFTIIACLWGNNINDYAVGFIKRDLDVEEELIDIEREFWEENVKKHNPPPLSSEHAKQEVEAFENYNIGSLIKSGKLKIEHSKKEINEAADKYVKTQEKIDILNNKVATLTSLRDVQKVLLLEKLANDKMLLAEDDNNSFLIKNKISLRRGVDVKRLKTEAPDIFEKYKKTSESSRFSVVLLNKK